jgi:hypothetical protein
MVILQSVPAYLMSFPEKPSKRYARNTAGKPAEPGLALRPAMLQFLCALTPVL